MERMNGGEIVEHMFIYMFFFFITGWRVQNESDLLWSLPIHTPREVCYRHASDSLSELFSSQFLFVLIAVCFVIAAYGEFLKANGEHAAGYLEKSAASMNEELREAEVVGFLCCLTNVLKFDLSFQIIRTAIGVHCR